MAKCAECVHVEVCRYYKNELLDCCGGSERLCYILKGEWKS